MIDPTVKAHLVHKARANSWQVNRCPYCGRSHQHGAGGPDDKPLDFLGHRIANCGKGGYFLRWWLTAD